MAARFGHLSAHSSAAADSLSLPAIHCSVPLEVPRAPVRVHAIETRSAWNRPLTHSLAWRCLADEGQIRMTAKCARNIVRRRTLQASLCDHDKKSGDIGAIRDFPCSDYKLDAISVAQTTVPTVYFLAVSHDIRRMWAITGMSEFLSSFNPSGIASRDTPRSRDARYPITRGKHIRECVQASS